MRIHQRTRYNENMGTFSERFPVLYDEDERRKKANKVLAVCRHYSGQPLEKLVCLDLGASTGIMTEQFARHFKKVIAIDLDVVGLKSAKECDCPDNIHFVCTDGTTAGLADESVDVVICNQIYEHVDNQDGLLSEIYRVMRYSGFCYFGAGNRYVLIEGHYFLPFLSWLPHWLADIYMKAAGKKGIYDVRLLSLRKLKKLTVDFWRHDYTRLIFENPQEFHADDVVRSGNIVSKLPNWLFSLLYPAFPAWVWVLTKKR
ncbi:MAG: class I SAM-dependent methyltransferase [Candidatus Zixiibacteriota bacterium]|nr:MAG: class I SAM-dependent methyltransferase [candidate division Zixibacteria bacterium]